MIRRVFEKLMFWKKKDDMENFNSGFGQQSQFGESNNSFNSGSSFQADPFSGNNFDNFSNPGMNQQFGRDNSFNSHNEPVFMPSAPAPQFDSKKDLQKDIEIISAKIDAIRASLESINQRVINIENIARGEQDKQQRTRW